MISLSLFICCSFFTVAKKQTNISKQYKFSDALLTEN